VWLPAAVLVLFTTAAVSAVVRVATPEERAPGTDATPAATTEAGSSKVEVSAADRGPARREPTREPAPLASATSGAPSPSASTAGAPSTAPPAPAPSAQPKPTCRAGSATLRPTADAYVDQAFPTRNFGSDADLLVAGRDKHRNRRALLRFTVPAVPHGCTLRVATLTLTAKTATDRRLVVTRTSGAWSEGGVTWNSRPAATGPASSAVVRASSASWAVAGQLAAVASGGPVSFALRDAGEDRSDGGQTNFSDRDGRKTPTLVLRWS
jgi:hypothetical protein